MLNIDIETSINSIPFLDYMNQNDNDDNGEQESIWKGNRPPKDDKGE